MAVFFGAVLGFKHRFYVLLLLGFDGNVRITFVSCEFVGHSLSSLDVIQSGRLWTLNNMITFPLLPLVVMA